MAYVVTGYWAAGYVTSDSESALVSELQNIAPSAVIELFQLELNAAQHGVNETFYFHAGVNANTSPIVWAGDTYMAIPIEASGFAWSGQGSLPRPTVSISNIMGTVTTLLATLPDGLEGAKVTRIRTLARYLDVTNFPSPGSITQQDGGILLTQDGGELQQESSNPTADPLAEWPREVYFVDRKSAETRDVVEFELASIFDMAGVRAPKRQCITRCQWVYRSGECGYTGSNYFDVNDNPVANANQDVCGKRISSCEARFGVNATLPYGGFPGIGSFYT